MIYIHVEEASMKSTLDVILPKIIGTRSVEIKVIEHGSKSKLLKDMPSRFAGYAQRLEHEDIRAIILVDRDDDQCLALKNQLETMAQNAGLPTKTAPNPSGIFRVVNRIVIEELEAWFFGDCPALCSAYSGVPATLANKAGYRDPDAILGGTNEKLLKVLQKAGHYKTASRLPKIAVARQISAYMDIGRNRSHSFNQFLNGLNALINL